MPPGGRATGFHPNQLFGDPLIHNLDCQHLREEHMQLEDDQLCRNETSLR